MSTPTQKDDDLFILPEDWASLDFEDVSKKAENNSDQITTIDENPDDFAFTLEDEQNTAPTEQNQEKSDDIDLLSLDTKDSLSSLSDSILSEPTKSEETANFDLWEFANKTEDEHINSYSKGKFNWLKYFRKRKTYLRFRKRTKNRKRFSFWLEVWKGCYWEK